MLDLDDNIKEIISKLEQEALEIRTESYSDITFIYSRAFRKGFRRCLERFVELYKNI